MARDPDWTHFRSFLEVLRKGSLSAAARSLGLTQPTLGRHIEALQAELGVGLFTRSPQGLAPTPAALALRAAMETMAAAADSATRAASAEAENRGGVVRLTASEVVSTEVLPPLLADYRRSNPGLVVELLVSNALEDVLRREVDIAVRMTRPTQQALLARRIGEIELGLFAHRDYLDRYGAPRSLADLSAHALIGLDRRALPAVTGGLNGLALTRDLFSFRTDNDAAALGALRAGYGLGVCQAILARRTPDLVRVLPQDLSFGLEIWVVMHEDLKAVRRMRLMFDALVEGLGAHVDGQV